MKILSFGEILWDCYPDKKYIGGAPLNFAAHLAKHGENVYMLSSLGDDELGEAAREYLKGQSISEEYVFECTEKETGKCIVTLDENQVPTYNLLPDVAYDYIPTDNVSDGFDVLYFGTLSLREEYNKKSLKRLLDSHSFKEVFVDINIRTPFYTAETVRFAVENATILKISLEELAVVSGLLEISGFSDYKEFTKLIADEYKNINCIIITLGEDGAYTYSAADKKEYVCESEPAIAVSTVGAGDSFSAAFLSRYLKNADIMRCLKHAAKIAAYVVSKIEAVPDYDDIKI